MSLSSSFALLHVVIADFLSEEFIPDILNSLDHESKKTQEFRRKSTHFDNQ